MISQLHRISIIGMLVCIVQPAPAAEDTIGPNGINSAGLLTATGQPLTGVNIGIGQVEPDRPGKPSFDDANRVHSLVVPTAVFFQDGAATANVHTGPHALQVAGVMISIHNTATGVATGAKLYSASASEPFNLGQDQGSRTAQHIAAQNSGDVRAINMSYGYTLGEDDELDGNSLFTQFIDWSAKQYDVLYVVSGEQDDIPTFPKDNYNGMTVGSAVRVDGVFRKVADSNSLVGQLPGIRTSISLIAPGESIEVTTQNSLLTVASGASFAAPHVTGTVALLQQYAEERITANAPQWGANARKHEVMKAVLMNSADKIKDDGMLAPVGSFLGMERTVLDQDDNNWLASDGFSETLIPLDDQMGAGHLNAKRALEQFAPGKFEADGADVPVRAWDYGATSAIDDVNKYVLSQSLLGGSYISIMLAFDRQVTFDQDGGTSNFYDTNDTFIDWQDTFPPADDVINDLDLYLMPKGATDFSEAIAESSSKDSTIDHIFAEIPTTGEYEIWVHQFDNDLGGTESRGGR